MHIVDMVYFWARTIPMRPAILETSRTITYENLALAVETAAERFARDIPSRSAPVAISISNGPRLLVALLGLLRAGFDVVLANPSLYKELAALGTNAVVLDRGGTPLEGGNNVIFDDRWLSFGANSPTRKVPFTKTEGGNILCFTSGTTGRPKVFACPQSSWQQRVLFPLNCAFFDYERILIVPPLSTSWGMSRAYEALHSGRTVCLAPFGEQALWMINTYGIDTFLASPKQALDLAEVQEAKRYGLTSLKSVQLGAASVSPASVKRLKKAFCENIIMFYGSTEAGVAALAPYDAIANTPGAVGYLMPGVDVEIVDTSDRALPVGKEGFVRVRSRVFTDNMAASKSSDQWFYTGDLGWITDAGILCIAGRINDVVNRGGEKLSIVDIENFLQACFGVKEAGACAITGAAGFSEVWVGLVLDPSADLAGLRHTIESNAHYKNNIDKIFVVETIPRGSLGKIQRDEFKKMLQEIAEQ